MITLPDKYCKNMKELLGEDGFNSYLESFSQKPQPAFRINTLKVDLEKWKEICPFSIERVPWCEKGFITSEDTKKMLSKHPYYFAGLYYIQEPSAMLPASILPIEKGDRVLDLCAAPGGKSVEIAAKLNGSGLLVANDISVSRAMALAKNLQIAGASNILVTAEPPERLTPYFKEYFDKILLDVPCSGEGMFRREPDMIKNWINKGPKYYSKIQKEILNEAYQMLKPGGNLVYSTCTFSVEEDEEIIQWFISKYSDIQICDIPYREGFSYGNLEKCVKIFPHIAKGEGHFVALLQKNGKCHNNTDNITQKKLNEKNDNKENKYQNKIKAVLAEFVSPKCYEKYCLAEKKNIIYLIPKETAGIKNLRIIQNGIIAGEIKKKFEPSIQLALSAHICSYKHKLVLSCTDIDVIKYLKGETINIDTDYKGWLLVTVDEFVLGWGKADGNKRLKNKYYAGWRMM